MHISVRYPSCMVYGVEINLAQTDIRTSVYYDFDVLRFSNDNNAQFTLYGTVNEMTLLHAALGQHLAKLALINDEKKKGK